MRPDDLQVIGDMLAIKWDGGAESFIPLETLRRCCPCAECKGEVDVMGHLHKGPERQLRPASFEVLRLTPVGAYAVQPMWGDGHTSGIYPYELLRRLADTQNIA